MKPIDDKSYKDAMKSVTPEFDEAMIWDGIEERLDRKDKKRFFIWFWLGSTAILLGLLILFMVKYNNKVELNIHSSVSEKEQTKKVNTITNSLVSNQDIPDELTSNPSLESIIKKTNTSSILSSSKNPTKQVAISKVVRANLRSISNDDNNLNQFSSRKIDEIQPVKAKGKIKIDELSELEFLKLEMLKFGQRDMSNIILEFEAPTDTESFTIEPMRRRLLFAAILGRPHSRYSDTNGLNQSWADNSKQANTDLYSLSLRAAYDVTVTEGLSMSLGLAMSRVSARFNRTFENIESMIVEQDSAIFILNAQGNQQFYQGSRIRTATTETIVQQYNHFYNIGISLGTMYEKPISNNLSAYAEAMVIYSPILIATGKSIDRDDRLIDISNNSASQLWQLSTGAGVNYRFSNRCSYQVGIQWTSDVSNRLLASELKLTNTDIGLRMGVIYMIK